MDFKDYYKILGVATDADLKAVKTAYRKLARKYHPDVSSETDAAERFKEVAEAYEVLGDDKKRAEYDEIRKYGGRQQGAGGFGGSAGRGGAGGFGGAQGDSFSEHDFSDFFSSIFGQRGQRSQRASGFDDPSGFRSRGRDIEVEMPVFLEDTLSDESKQIKYSLPHYDAHGQRLEDITKTLKIKIPKGVADGERIRLKGQGAPGLGDGPAGDLYLRVRLVPHPQFDVEAHNLLTTVPLAPWEAALGAKITVPTLQGRIQLTIPPNSQSGQRLRVKGRGLPMKSGKGDLFAVLKIVLPPSADEVTKKLWQQLAEQQASFDPRKQA